MRIFYHNLGGAKSFIHKIRAAIISSDYDVIMLTETWFNDAINNEELFDSNWSVYRRDRSCTLNDHREGGGVLIAVRNDFPSCRMPSLNSSIEQLSVKMTVNQRSLFLNVVYIPPSSETDIYENYVLSMQNFIDNVVKDDELIVAGDFNLPNLQWMCDDDNSLIYDAANVRSDH